METAPTVRVLTEIESELTEWARLNRGEIARRRRQRIATATKQVNKCLNSLGNYHDSVPLDVINDCLTQNGFEPLETTILCGREGRINEPVGSSRWLSLAWYKMESGRYEVTAYVS